MHPMRIALVCASIDRHVARRRRVHALVIASVLLLVAIAAAVAVRS